MTIIKAKPTLYRGTRFRSRLEARWAVFFDAIGREWVYEPKFPELSGLNYQPDFLLDGPLEGTSVVEVKPWPGDPGSWAKFAGYLNEAHKDERYPQVASILQTRMVLLVGSPGVWEQGKLTDYGSAAISWYRDQRVDRLLEWAECDQCGTVGLWADGFADCCWRSLPTGPLYEAFCRVRDESYEDPS